MLPHSLRKGFQKPKKSAQEACGTRIKGRGGLKEGKIPIIAITERSDKSAFFVALEGLSEELILELLGSYVEKGSIVNTDDDFLIYTKAFILVAHARSILYMSLQAKNELLFSKESCFSCRARHGFCPTTSECKRYEHVW